ncbi:MAG: DDE-type integrase/transposase/recombinase [Anaerolineae bacterium]
MTLVTQTRQRSDWPVRRTLQALEIPLSSYYRWRRAEAWQNPRSRSPAGSMYELLDSERRAILDYALKHPEVRHRELAWRMLDEGVCSVSASSVYRVLREANLVCRWKPKARVKGEGRDDKATRPDQQWQTDIKYIRVSQRNYYLLSFMDVYSRYIAHHELLTCMDGLSVSTEAAAALETLDGSARPDIQSDHGSGFIAREFAETLRESGVTHKKIRPHTPTDNAEIERYHRTIGEQIDQYDLENATHAKAVIAQVIDNYNHVRLHSSLSFLRPVDYYRGDPEALLAQRRRKLRTARELRKQENIKLRQRLLPWTEDKNVTYPERQTVSL